jgi:hypothetical protein
MGGQRSRCRHGLGFLCAVGLALIPAQSAAPAPSATFVRCCFDVTVNVRGSHTSAYAGPLRLGSITGDVSFRWEWRARTIVGYKEDGGSAYFDTLAGTRFWGSLVENVALTGGFWDQGNQRVVPIAYPPCGLERTTGRNPNGAFKRWIADQPVLELVRRQNNLVVTAVARTFAALINESRCAVRCLPIFGRCIAVEHGDDSWGGSNDEFDGLPGPWGYELDATAKIAPERGAFRSVKKFKVAGEYTVSHPLSKDDYPHTSSGEATITIEFEWFKQSRLAKMRKKLPPLDGSGLHYVECPPGRHTCAP